MSTYVIN